MTGSGGGASYSRALEESPTACFVDVITASAGNIADGGTQFGFGTMMNCWSDGPACDVTGVNGVAEVEDDNWAALGIRWNPALYHDHVTHSTYLCYLSSYGRDVGYYVSSRRRLLSEQQLQQPQHDGNQRDGEDNSLMQSTEIGQATSDAQPVEIDISQPTASDVEDSQKDHGIKRPSKLSPRRRSSPLATSVPVNSMQGASSGTTTRLVNYMKFIPTPGFKAPRKKN
ncbi:uncharacterized protein LOC110271966 [Arachis ipaensis]|uniref:uncharacterized protein LOC110271966 n=1 Tax=Arachis ipaensis TaxID=130454 RepID=UPI000A2B0715|nr:uncharacterized protein LOC110271966 [Arachis ipaensis]